MTADQIAEIQASFRHVLPIMEQAASLFYGRLFEVDPALRPLFAHTDMTAQGRKLMAALGFVVGALPAPEPMLATVRQLAIRHIGYGVRESHYQSVGAALLWTLETALGDAWTPGLRTAWADAYALVSGAMIQAAAQPAASANPHAA